MKIDVIIPLYKPGKELLTLLEMLHKQTLPPHQIILMNTEEKYLEALMMGSRRITNFPDVKAYISVNKAVVGSKLHRYQ